MYREVRTHVAYLQIVETLGRFPPKKKVAHAKAEPLPALISPHNEHKPQTPHVPHSEYEREPCVKSLGEAFRANCCLISCAMGGKPARSRAPKASALISFWNSSSVSTIVKNFSNSSGSISLLLILLPLRHIYDPYEAIQLL